MQRRDGLAGTGTAAHARGPVGDVADDPRLRRVQVEHPLLDRAAQDELEVARPELGDRVADSGERRRSASSSSSIRASSGRGRRGRRRRSRGSGRGRATCRRRARPTPARAQLGERLADLDGVAERADRVGSRRRPGRLACKLGCVEDGERVLRARARPSAGSAAAPRRRASVLRRGLGDLGDLHALAAAVNTSRSRCS